MALKKTDIFNKLLELKLIPEGKTIEDYDYKTLGIMLKEADPKESDDIDEETEPDKYEFDGKKITKEKYHQLKRAGLIK
jgi:hypothetical protein